MKLLLALVILFVTATIAKKTRVKGKQKGTRSNSESDEQDDFVSDEGLEEEKPAFNMRGSLKRHYAIEAILTKPKVNFVCSPISALFPLAKLVFGTNKGKSREELLAAIGTKQKSVKRKFKSYIHELKYLPGVLLIVANRIYVNKSIKISKSYMNRVTNVFQSGIVKINYNKAVESSNKINEWIKEQTRGYIKHMLSPSDISPSASMIIVNAVYFRGFWQRQFTNVFIDDFHSPMGTRRVPFMKQKNFYYYLKSEPLGAKIIDIPFIEGKTSMVVVLPLTKTGLEGVLSKLQKNPDLINDEMKHLFYTKVSLTLPRFKSNTELNLRGVYEKIGVKEIFHDSGLDGIANNSKVHVSKALQKTYIEVTEMGAEAAAATGFDVVPVSNLPSKEFEAIHPFLFFVKANGEQLFVGVVNTPDELSH